MTNKKILQINVVSNSGSTGRIAESIGGLVLQNGWRSIVAFGRKSQRSKSELFRIGNNLDIYYHVFLTRLFDRHGLSSKRATKRFVEYIEKIKPDLIHIHNIHGYFLNYPILFEYLKDLNIPIVWTLHDCWSFTGHCTHFMTCNCNKWLTGCFQCPLITTYPKSFFFDASSQNYALKRKYFTSLKNLTLVTVSDWQKQLLPNSFFKDIKSLRIYNGIDTDIFRPHYDAEVLRKKYKIPTNSFLILGVANVWTKLKGLEDFIKLGKIIDKKDRIILVGLNKKQLKKLPENIIGIERTENTSQLAQLYSIADVFVNPTWEDNFPTTNIESLSCGTPVITYKTGGSPEAVDTSTGFTNEKGNIEGLIISINEIKKNGKQFYQDICRQRALNYFNKNHRFEEYIQLYKDLM